MKEKIFITLSIFAIAYTSMWLMELFQYTYDIGYKNWLKNSCQYKNK